MRRWIILFCSLSLLIRERDAFLLPSRDGQPTLGWTGSKRVRIPSSVDSIIRWMADRTAVDENQSEEPTERSVEERIATPPSYDKKKKGFDLDTALFAAGLAFDSYVEPPADSSRWERGVSSQVESVYHKGFCISPAAIFSPKE